MVIQSYITTPTAGITLPYFQLSIGNPIVIATSKYLRMLYQHMNSHMWAGVGAAPLGSTGASTQRRSCAPAPHTPPPLCDGRGSHGWPRSTGRWTTPPLPQCNRRICTCNLLH